MPFPDSEEYDDDDAGHSASTAGGENCEYKQVRSQVNKETRRVQLGRCLVILSILMAGAAVSSLTYVILSRELESDSGDAVRFVDDSGCCFVLPCLTNSIFLHYVSSQFVLFANTIEDSFKFNIAEIFEASRSLGRAVTTAAMTATPASTFPNVTVPAFEVKAFEARTKAGFEMVSYAPVARNLDEWIAFSTENTGWFQESKEIFDQLEPGQNRSLEAPVTSMPSAVYRLGEDGIGDPWANNRLFCPSMHTSPPPSESASIIMNVDFFSSPEFLAVSLASEQLKDAVFSSFKSKTSVSAALLEGKLTGDLVDSAKPRSISAQPVYRGLSADEKFAVGYVFTFISWEEYLVNLLPEGVHGIVVVLKNSCGDAVSYSLEGNMAVYVGVGDIHEQAFESSKRTIDFSENYYDPERTRNTEGHCQVYLDVYSSARFQSNYESNLPWIFALVVAGLFLLMALVFIFYDRCVNMRNNKVIGAAARSAAIVRSLFPSTVHDRLMEAHDSPAKGGSKSRKNAKNSASLEGYLDGDLKAQDTDMDDEDADLYKSKPIADLFPQTTIMVRVRASHNDSPSQEVAALNETSPLPSMSPSLFFQVCRHCRFYGLEQCPRTVASFCATGDSLPRIVSTGPRPRAQTLHPKH